MTEQEKIQKTIRHMECVRANAQATLDNGFGTHEGESTLVYDNRIMYADTAIKALEKQIPKKPCYAKDYIGVTHCECGCVLMTGQHHCSKCGQRIDWRDFK